MHNIKYKVKSCLRSVMILAKQTWTGAWQDRSQVTGWDGLTADWRVDAVVHWSGHEQELDKIGAKLLGGDWLTADYYRKLKLSRHSCFVVE